MLSCLLNSKYINTFEYKKEDLKIWSDNNLLLCPLCNEPYEYCHGKVVIPYFRHKNKNECIYSYSESETDEHLLGKKVLYEWIKTQEGVSNVILEGWLPETKQRPDIMFKKLGIQYVIEYQCSPIATEYYERHNLYKAVGIKDIWICGTNKYFSTREKECRLKTIGKESRIYFNPTESSFYIPSFTYELYGLQDCGCLISGEHRLYKLPISQAIFTDRINLPNEVKIQWLNTYEKNL